MLQAKVNILPVIGFDDFEAGFKITGQSAQISWPILIHKMIG